MTSITEFKGEYRWLSNFWSSKYAAPTVEHRYQASKALYVVDHEKIMDAKTPAEAKQIGRYITIRKDWDDVKLAMMRALIELKFNDSELASKLIATGSALFTEGNYWHDNYWGECYCKKCSGKVKENHLGLILMAERSKLIGNKK